MLIFQFVLTTLLPSSKPLIVVLECAFLHSDRCNDRRPCMEISPPECITPPERIGSLSVHDSLLSEVYTTTLTFADCVICLDFFFAGKAFACKK